MTPSYPRDFRRDRNFSDGKYDNFEAIIMFSNKRLRKLGIRKSPSISPKNFDLVRNNSSEYSLLEKIKRKTSGSPSSSPLRKRFYSQFASISSGSSKKLERKTVDNK